MSDNHIMNTTVRLLGQLDPSLAKSIQTAEKNFKKMDKTAFAVNATYILFALNNLLREFLFR